MKMIMEKDLEKLEIKPLGFNLFVAPYEKNPYLEHKTKGGLVLTDGEFSNPDSGEIDKMVQDVVCGKVIEVGSKCTEVRKGDDVLFRIRTAIPIPFMNQGFWLTNEPNILSVINTDLSTR